MSTTIWRDEPVLTTSGGGLTMAVSAARGGKIVSLRDAAGIEWLAQPLPGPLPRPAEPGDEFTEAEMCGWDECAPTIDAGSVDGRPVPDHGDLWTVRFDANGSTVSAIGPSLGYRFTRTAVGTERGIRLDYEAEALEAPTPFLWTAHPQFDAPYGTRLQFDTPPTSLVDVTAPTSVDVPYDDNLLTLDSLPPHGCRKVYLPPAHRSHGLTLVRPDGTLRMSWSETVPYLGVWFDNSSVSTQRVIAPEPALGFYDSLEFAVSQDRTPRLTPGTPLRWWVELSQDPRTGAVASGTRRV